MQAIRKDGLIVAIVDDTELIHWFHRKHGYSMMHAVEYEGYSVADATDEEVSEMAQRQKTKVVPASEAGYSEGWIARYYSPLVQAWFDIGGPLDTRQAAEIRRARYEETGEVI